MQQIHFLSFGDTKRFTGTLERICKEAENMEIFDKIHKMTENDLDSDFLEKHKHFMFTNRGFGFWVWKSQVTKQVLREMNENDILIYADAGCTLNKNGLERLKELIKIVNDSPFANIAFRSSRKEKIMTKWELLSHLNYTKTEELDTVQLLSGCYILRKTPEIVDLVDKWVEVSSNHDLLHQNFDKNIQLPDFIEHRYEQSMFSILRKQYGYVLSKYDLEGVNLLNFINATRLRNN